MDLTEKCLDSERKYSGLIVNVRLDTAELSSGALEMREVVEHCGGVAVLPVDDDGICCMVRQFRYPFSRKMLEVPAGKLEPGEEPEQCAIRELSEETGLRADRLVPMGSVCASPGYLTEEIHIFLALGLHQGDSHPDENELLSVERHSLTELADRALCGEIRDSKTVIALLKAEKFFEQKTVSQRDSFRHYI